MTAPTKDKEPGFFRKPGFFALLAAYISMVTVRVASYQFTLATGVWESRPYLPVVTGLILACLLFYMLVC